MNYKTSNFSCENNSIECQSEELTIYVSKTYISSQDLPKYLGFHDLYDVISRKCNRFIERVNLNDFVKANQTIANLTQKIYDQKDKIVGSGKKIDFSNILRIFVRTHFIDVVFDLVNSLKEDYFNNCAFFICAFTFLSNDFRKFFSNCDFIYPLTIFYIKYKENLTIDQKKNIIFSIINLIEYYEKERQYSVFFNNALGISFHQIYDAFRIVSDFQLLKFYYVLTINAENISENYPILLGFFCSVLNGLACMQPINEEVADFIGRSFNLTVLSLYSILKKDPNQIVSFYTLHILEYVNDLYKTNEKCGDHWVNFYALVTKVVRNFDKMVNNDFDWRCEVIFKLLTGDDNKLNEMLESSNHIDNNCVLDLIDALISKKLFKVFFDQEGVNDAIDTTKKIIEILQDSPLNTKRKALICLRDLLRDNFDFYSPTILINIKSSIFTDFLLSEDHNYQIEAINFLYSILVDSKFVNKAISQNDSTFKNFAFALYEDEEFMEEISSEITPFDAELDQMAKIIRRQIDIWVDAPYDSTNTLNDNYVE